MGGGGGGAAVALAQSQADVNVKLSWALGQKCFCVIKLSELRQKLKEFVSDGFDIDLPYILVYKSNFLDVKMGSKKLTSTYSGEHETYLPNHKKMPKFTATSQVTELSKEFGW